MEKWENFTKEQLEEFVKTSYSLAEVAKKIGYNPKGGSYSTTIKEMINYYHFDTSHFTGQGWNKGNFDYFRFQKGRVIKTGTALKALAHKRGHRCECCGLETWNEQPIPLQVHHKDGDRYNNEEDNLELLCPNCHALTDTFCGKNIDKKREIISEEKLVEALRNNKNIRQALLSVGLTGKGANYFRARELIIKYNIEHLLEKENK